MSRIGKKLVVIPAKVEVKLEGQELTVKGPKGELKQTLHPDMTVERRAPFRRAPTPRLARANPCFGGKYGDGR